MRPIVELIKQRQSILAQKKQLDEYALTKQLKDANIAAENLKIQSVYFPSLQETPLGYAERKSYVEWCKLPC